MAVAAAAATAADADAATAEEPKSPTICMNHKVFLACIRMHHIHYLVEGKRLSRVPRMNESCHAYP